MHGGDPELTEERVERRLIEPALQRLVVHTARSHSPGPALGSAAMAAAHLD